MANWEHESLYDEHSHLQSIKPLSTVDQSQISEPLTTTTTNIDRAYWQAGETVRRGDLDEREQRPSSAHAVMVNPVVPSVVEEKAAEEDDLEAALQPRRPNSRSRCRDVDGVVRATTSARPLPYPALAFNGHCGARNVGGPMMPLGLNIPYSVCMPKDEPQTVPVVVTAGGTEMARQGVDSSKNRLDRKRELNRLAAQKCRQRKLEQLAVLQDRVEKLNRDKVELQRTADALRRQVEHFERVLRQHASAGCRIGHASSFHL